VDFWFLFITWLFGSVWDQSGGESSVGGKILMIEISSPTFVGFFVCGMMGRLDYEK